MAIYQDNKIVKLLQHKYVQILEIATSLQSKYIILYRV